LENSRIGERKSNEGKESKGKKISSNEELDQATIMGLLSSIELHV